MNDRITRIGRKGFTLIELLVVIAIIAVLAAILFPVFANAKKTAMKSKCLNQLKQIGTGLMLYMGDNNDSYPPWSYVESSWALRLLKYTKNQSVFHCPGDPTKPRDAADQVSVTYFYNRLLCKDYDVFQNQFGEFPLKNSQVSNATKLIMLFETGIKSYSQSFRWADSDYRVFYYGGKAETHGSYGFTCMLCDGHACYVKDNRGTKYNVLTNGSYTVKAAGITYMGDQPVEDPY
jgi:prepilin-type N-terminal cleavage/methylation domain-containing protein